jgi:four helix bundle protein
VAAKNKNDREYDLGERLLEFAVRIMNVVEKLPKTRAGNHIAGQLLRCGTAPAPNHSEAQSAESRRDFVHKMRIALKELRETKVWLQIILRKMPGNIRQELESLVKESDELISIFFSSIRTAEKNTRAGIARHG